MSGGSNKRPPHGESKDALIAVAWNALAIEESSLPVEIAALRRVLAQEPGGENWIETLPRRGYRLGAREGEQRKRRCRDGDEREVRHVDFSLKASAVALGWTLRPLQISGEVDSGALVRRRG